MIKLNRSRLPVPLPLRPAALENWLDEIRQYYALDTGVRHRRRPPFSELVLDHILVRGAIDSLSGSKCAYCEQRIESHRIVGHYRPISDARSYEHEVAGSPDHYAWLVYEWRNLLPFCGHCNSSKANAFPVNGKRAPVLTPWAQLKHVEDALLLDPATDDPYRHIRFEVSGLVVSQSMRGHATIEALNLNRSVLVERRAAALRDLVREIANGTDVKVWGQRLLPGQEFSGVQRIFLQQVCLLTQKDSISSVRSLKLESLLDIVQRQFARNPSGWLTAVQTGSITTFGLAIGELDSPGPLNGRLSRAEVSSVQIRNFKGITSINLKLENETKESRGATCTVILGENATGKSTVLQSICMALSDAQTLRELGLDAAGRRRVSMGKWLLDAKTSAKITVSLSDGVVTAASLTPKARLERTFAMERPVLLAYGARRQFSEGKGDAPSYAFKSLFDSSYRLPDPMLWFQTLTDAQFNDAARALRIIMGLGEGDDFSLDRSGRVEVRSGRIVTSVDTMSDGYKAMFYLAVDIMRHMLQEWANLQSARGVVLIDEIETHLHPRWKMRIMSSLREAMPLVQFIVTTHDPLCLRGMRAGEVIVLYRDVDGEIRALSDLPDVSRLSVEQILLSDYFGLSTISDPQSDESIRELAIIAALEPDSLSDQQVLKRDEFLDRYGSLKVIGNSIDRQIVARALTAHIEKFGRVPLGERRVIREDAVADVLQVLERAMRK